MAAVRLRAAARTPKRVDLIVMMGGCFEESEYSSNRPFEEAKIEVFWPSHFTTSFLGDPFGQFYKLDAIVDISDSGSYLIQSRIERTGD